jgi:hypothetical protein
VDAVDFWNGGSKKLVFRSGGGSRGRTLGRREAGDGSADDPTDPTGGGGVDSNGNETAGGPLRKIENSTCMSMYDINRMCKFGLISRVRTFLFLHVFFQVATRTFFGATWRRERE